MPKVRIVPRLVPPPCGGEVGRVAGREGGTTMAPRSYFLPVKCSRARELRPRK